MDYLKLQDLEQDTVEWAKDIMSLQNENPYPETGTMGFIMGCAMALGNTAAVFNQMAPRAKRKQFERIVLEMVTESMRDPFVTGTPIIPGEPN